MSWPSCRRYRRSYSRATRDLRGITPCFDGRALRSVMHFAFGRDATSTSTSRTMRLRSAVHSRSSSAASRPHSATKASSNRWERRAFGVGLAHIPASPRDPGGVLPRFRGGQKRRAPEPDTVNPSHYDGNVECFDALWFALTPEDLRCSCRGGAIAYLWRLDQADATEREVRRAAWFVSWLQGERPRAVELGERIGGVGLTWIGG